MAKTTTYAETVFTAKDAGFQRVSDRVNASAKAMAKNFAKVAAVTVAGAGAFGAFVKVQLSVAESLSDTANKANASVTALQKLRFAADQNGSSASEMDDALTRLTRRMSMFAQDGTGPAAKAIEALSLNVVDANGNLRESTAVFDDVVAKMARLESGAEKAALASQLFGDRLGPKLLPLLNQGSAAIDAMGRKAEKLGLVLNETGVRKAAALNAELRALGQGIKTQLTAAVVDNIGQIRALADVFTQLIPVAITVATKIGAIAAGIIGVAEAVRLIGSATPTGPIPVPDSIKGTRIEIPPKQQARLDAYNVGHGPMVGDQAGVGDAALSNVLRSRTRPRVFNFNGSGRGGAPIGDTPGARVQQTIARFNDQNASMAATAGGGGGAGGGGVLSPTDSEIQALRERLATVAEMRAMQIEQAGEFYDNQLTALTEARDREIITEQEFYDLKERLAKEHEDKIGGIRGTSFNAQLGYAGKFFGDLANVTASGGERLAKISKSFAAAEALVNAYRAASQTLADPSLPFFAKFSAAAGVLAAGMGFVSAIKGGGAAAGGAAAGGVAGGGQGPTVQPSNGGGSGQAISINMIGEQFSRESVLAMFEKLNEAIEDGATISGIGAT